MGSCAWPLAVRVGWRFTLGLGVGALFLVVLSRCVSGTNPEQRAADNASLASPSFTGTVADPRRFSFMAVGDTHLGGGNLSRIERILDDGTARGSSFFIILGDIVDRGAFENYAPLSALLQTEGWTGRFFSILGNHDILPGSWDEYKRNFGRSYYTFDVGNSRFIALDTADGALGDAQWQWFEGELDKVRPEHTFVLTHYMPVVPNQDTYLKMPTVEETARFLSVCARHRVTAVLGGHYHSYTHQNISGTEYVVAGGGGGKCMAPENRHFYVEVTVDGSEVRHELRPLE